jgi:C4-dicarboxylate-specific signal transduction histidine kinase
MNASDLVPLGHGLAGLSHDLKNVLATLGESIGLLEDLVGAGSVLAPDGAAGRAFERLSRQLARADVLASRLSRFAHTFDDPDTAQPLSHLVDQVLFLVDRRARSRPIALSVELDDAPPVTRSIEVLLRLAALVESAVDTLPAGSRLRVSCDGDRVIVTGETDGAASASGEAEFLPEDTGSPPSVDFSVGGVAAIRLS